MASRLLGAKVRRSDDLRRDRAEEAAIKGGSPAVRPEDLDNSYMAPTADGVLVGGDNGVILRATASGAELLYEQPGLFLYGLSYSANVGFAVGWNGTVLRLDGDDVT